MVNPKLSNKYVFTPFTGFWVVLIFVFFHTQFVSAYTPKPGTPLATGEHPRLHITNATIPALRSAIANQHPNEYQKYVNWAYDLSGKDNYLGDHRHFPLKAAVVHKAFIYAVGNVPGISYPQSLEQYARQGIDRLITDLATSIRIGASVAVSYDWLYNAMTPAERQQIANLVKDLEVSHLEADETYTFSNPDFTPSKVAASSYAESAYAWYFGLAFYGDGTIDSIADTAIDSIYQTHLLDYGYIDALNFMSGNAGGESEWIGYGNWHPRSHFLFLDGLRTATGENYIANRGPRVDGNFVSSWPSWIQYAVDPFEYDSLKIQYLKLGFPEADSDMRVNHPPMQEMIHMLPRILASAGKTTEAGLMKDFVSRYNVDMPGHDFNQIWAWLGVTDAAPAVSMDTLEMPKYVFSKNLGVFLARTGFSSQADGVFTAVDAHWTFSGHQGPTAQPGFTLNKFGTLVNMQEVSHRGYGNLYKYPGGFGKQNIVKFDGGEFDTVDVDGIYSPSEFAKVHAGSSVHDLGGIEQVTIGQGEIYHVRVKRDRQFNPGVKVGREYVWIPGETPETDSDFLVVYDRTLAPSQPHWLYHVPWKPEAQGEDSTADLTTGSGERDRIGTRYTGSNIIVKELNSVGGPQDGNKGEGDFVGGLGAHGVMFSKTLLPKTAHVEFTRVAQLDGQVLNRQGAGALKTHRWQVDVRPTAISPQHRFLHVFETADANLKTSMQPTSLLEFGDELHGVWIERLTPAHTNHVVLFNREEGPKAQNVTYTVTGNGSVKHIVTGLRPLTNYKIENSTKGTTLFAERSTENNTKLWDYKGVATNNPTGILIFEDSISGQESYVLTPVSTSGQTPDFTPPSPPDGLTID